MAKLASFNAHGANATPVSELKITDSDRSENVAFGETLEKLTEVFTVDDLDSSLKIKEMLIIGQQYLRMPNGVVGSVMGDSLEIICAVGDMAEVAKPGKKAPIAGTLCSVVLESDEPVAIHNIPASEFAQRCTGPVPGLQSYIGTQVLTSNGPLGTICFFSKDTRDRAFSENEIRILTIIACWVGNVIGNEEQLEFLSHQNDYYHSLFRTVPSMLMLCNDDGLILATSNRLCTEIGIDPVKLPGQYCQTFFIQSDRTIISDALTQGEFDHLPSTLLRANGDELEVELNSCIKEIGSMQGVRMIVLSDVSERNKAMTAVEKQNKQLALVNQSLNQFACMASHDLQEPLRKIQQFAHFLAEDLGKVMTEDGQYHLDVINNSAKRMSTLIQDLLEFSSAAQDDLVVTDVDLSDLLEEVCSELELRIEESGAHIIVAALPMVQGDKSLIRQLFTNLISNSLKYRDKNRAPIINIETLQIDDSLAVTVVDNGIGFDQKLVSRAFEPFSRLHTDKEYKGNGIGLSICATVCEKHNWKLSATSTPGTGSQFTIAFAS